MIVIEPLRTQRSQSEVPGQDMHIKLANKCNCYSSAEAVGEGGTVIGCVYHSHTSALHCRD